MDAWKSSLALIVGIALAAGPVWAQTTTPSGGTTGGTGTTDAKTGATDMKTDSADTKAEKKAQRKEEKAEKQAEKAEMRAEKRDGRKERMAGGGDRDQVKVAQQALKDKGHDPGPIDGTMGPKTRAALKDFQKAEGLKDTGRLDPETTAKLGVESKAGSAGPAASPATADKPRGPVKVRLPAQGGADEAPPAANQVSGNAP